MSFRRWQWFAGSFGVLIIGFMLNVFVISDISHDRAQRLLYAEFRSSLKNGGAPVDSPVAAGTPVAIIKIPSIDVDEVVVEGTSSRDLQRGVGHLRSSALPGQYGTSVLIGRRTSFGGAFGEIGSLEAGDEIQVVSAQGTTTYRVASKDTFGGEDAAAFAPAGNALRLVTSASTFGTSKRLSVLALAEKGTAFPVGLKSAISPVSLDELGANMNHQNAGSLLVWLQILIAALAGAIWAVSRWGLRSAWPMVSPVILVVLYVVSNQLIGILPSYF
jgi:sortase A